eukprot:g40745.t1
MLAAQECFLDQRLALRAVFDSTTLPSTSSSLSRVFIFLSFPAGCSNYSNHRITVLPSVSAQARRHKHPRHSLPRTPTVSGSLVNLIINCLQAVMSHFTAMHVWLSLPSVPHFANNITAEVAKYGTVPLRI